MNSISRLWTCRALPCAARLDRLRSWPLLSAFLLLAFLLTALTSSAQTPASPAGGLPSASRLQSAYDQGRAVGNNTSQHERIEDPFTGSTISKAPKDLLREKLDDYVKEHGSSWSDAEKEVFREAYWNGAEEVNSMGVQLGSPTLTPPGPTTTNVSGKTSTPGSGTLQLTDDKGNSYFVDVDKDGKYSTTVPLPNFSPIKMTLRTATLKAVWQFTQNGTWEQVSGTTISASSPSTVPTQGAMAPARGDAAQQVASFDECKKYGAIGSLNPDSFSVTTLPNPQLHHVRFTESRGMLGGRPENPRIWLVGGPLTPQEIQDLTDLGAKVSDLEHQISELDKQLRNPNLSDAQKTDLNRQKQELDNSKWRNEGTVRDQYGSKQEAKDVFEKAKEARKKQRELEQAEHKAAQDPSDKKAQRTVNRLKLELQDLQRGIGTLPPLAMGATTPGIGSSTGANVATTPGATTSQAVNVAFTGTWKPKRKPGKETQTADISTLRVAVSYEGKDETPETFVQGKDLAWTGIDCKKIGLSYALADKTFSIGSNWTRYELKTYQDQYTHANVYGASVPTADLGYYGGRRRITVPQLATEILDLPAQRFGGTNLDQVSYPIPVGDFVIDNTLSHIKLVPKSTNAWKLSEDLVRGGLPNMDAWSSGFLTPSGNRLYTYSLDSPAQANQAMQIAGNRIDYIEKNEDATAAPAGWLPSSWPRTQAQALPSFRIRREIP